jgi:hypothetical protein
VTDAAGGVIWERLLALQQPLRGRPAPGRAALRALLPHGPVVESLLEREHRHAREAASDELRALLDLALRREQALMKALTERHARISASLLQPGLFDRRVERQAAAQQLLVDEALARCRLQLDRLAHRKALACGVRDLVFGVVVA